MNNFLALLVWLVMSNISLTLCTAQSIKRQVLQNIKKIHSLEFGNSFEDLESLGDAIGDARIVMLGEQSHGDGSTFRAKARLVKYLHEKRGFEVLALESDFFALSAGWSTVPKDSSSIKQFLQHNVYPVWSFSEECKELFYKYLPDKESFSGSLRIAGIDPQMHGLYTRNYLVAGLTEFFQSHKVALSQSQQEQDICLKLVDTLYILNAKPRGYIDSLMRTDFAKRLSTFDSSAQNIIEHLPHWAHSSEFYQALKNLKIFAFELLNLSNAFSTAARDEQMADNLKWLLNYKYPDKKVIVWAANRHIMKNSLSSFKKMSSNTLSMGTSFTANKELSSQTYILGFTSLMGSSQTVFQKKAFEIRKPKQGFESWLPQEMEFGFLNSKAILLDSVRAQLFIMKARGHSAVEANWLDIFDGIFYIRNMKSANLITN